MGFLHRFLAELLCRGCECVSEQKRVLTPQQIADRRRRLWKKYFWRRIAILGVLATFLVAMVTLVVTWIIPDEPPAVVQPETPVQPEIPEKEEEPLPQIPYPVADGDTIAMGADVDANYAVLVDVTDGRIVAQKGANVRTYPASITKMLTLLVAVENVEDLESTYEMSYAVIDPVYRQGASMAGFKSEEKVRLLDMLYGCILPSGADATAGLAAAVAGSDEGFADLMNQKAKELGLKDTHFTNNSGLHGADHYTTATDMAVILMAAMEEPTCREVLSTVEYTSAKTPQNPDGLTWTSTMFSRMYADQLKRDGYDYGVTFMGGKTGYTTEAGHTMASYVNGGNGHDYVIVTMDGNNRYKATYDHLNIMLRYVCGETEKFY